MFDIFVNFTGGAVVDNPRPCPHVVAYARELGYEEYQSSKALWPLPRKTHAAAVSQRIAAMGTRFSDPMRGVFLIDLEIAERWRAAGATGQQIAEELDWLASTARYVLGRDVGYVGPEDSPYCRFRAPMMYYPNGWRAAPLLKATKPLIPFVWNHAVSSNPRTLSKSQTAALAAELVTLNGEVGLNEGVIGWSYARTAADQRAFLAWVELLAGMCREDESKAEIDGTA